MDNDTRQDNDRRAYQLMLEEPGHQLLTADMLCCHTRAELRRVMVMLQKHYIQRGWSLRIIWNSQVKGILATDDSWLPF